MQNPADPAKPTMPTLRAEPRNQPKPAAEQAVSGHIKGVKATSGGLIRDTLGAAAAAGLILTLFWLPSEHGIDPTGIGAMLGLTEMGEIKQQLFAENAADAATIAFAGSEISARLDGIDARLAAIIATLEAPVIAAPAPEPAAVIAPAAAPAAVIAPAAAPAAVIAPAAAPAPATAPTPEPAAALWRDEVSYTLAPGEGIEIKLVMEKDAVATFEWDAGGSVLNFDTHGDGSGQQITYERGRAMPGQQSTLTAAFSGNHGWFWRNRTDVPVTITLRTGGDYSSMIAP